MAVLTTRISFPHAPITSVSKRIVKGVEHLYYAKLFVSNRRYDSIETWQSWHHQGFHVATFDAPPAAAKADRIRTRLQAPAATPIVTVTGENADALKDLLSLLEAVEALRPDLAGKSAAQRDALISGSQIGNLLLSPMNAKLGMYGFVDDEPADFQAALRRGINAIADERATAIAVSLT